MNGHLILISHGNLCEELKKSTEMIMGPQETIHSVALLPSEGPDEFKEKFEKTVENLEEYVVFADLMGGTPCNVVSKMILTGLDIELYAGMNMPMVIGYINGCLTGEKVDLIEMATSNTKLVNQVLADSFDDEDE